ncbi:hypothetical protein [uncultured Microscilla sp.]|uniref:hypothetical protein n=1 Tax=uncultured Microscilla sp. TaxID=432653 RepID=UPI002633B364|nr:hypothetical protein [uncultured Microscilla sp.]
MAFDFSLWIHAGDNTEQVGTFLHTHTSIETKLNQYNLHLQTHKNHHLLKTDQVSQVGIRSLQDAHEMSLIGFEFLKILLKAPPFHYAMVGLGLTKWRDLHEFLPYPKDLLLTKGFVVREDIYNKMEISADTDQSFRSDIGFFRNGYLWIPYIGEWEFPF